MSGKTREELLAEAIYSILRGEDGDGKTIPGRDKIRSYFHSVPSISDKFNSTEPKEAIKRTIEKDKLLRKDLEDILKNEFHLEVHNSSNKGFVVALFREIVPHLLKYIFDHEDKIFHSKDDNYNVLLRFHHSLFPSLDDVVLRKNDCWTAKTVQDGFLLIRPISSLAELNQFISADANLNSFRERSNYYTNRISPDAPFCFFKPDSNLAQLYLYAAHRDCSLLGIWLDNRAFGLLPMLHVDVRWGHSQVVPSPAIYLEATMTEKDPNSIYLRGDQREITLSDIIYHVFLEYAVLNKGFPRPIIGNMIKSNSHYTSIVSQLPRLAGESAHNHFRRKYDPNAKYESPRLKSFIDNSGKQRKVVSYPPLQGGGFAYLQLKEDPALLDFLKSNGYKFNRIVMNSQAFLYQTYFDEDNSLCELGNHPEYQGHPYKKRALLYGDWGDMEGWSFISYGLIEDLELLIPNAGMLRWDLSDTKVITIPKNVKKYRT